MRHWFILDISKTLVMMETLTGKINPYDVALEIISRERFQGITMNMKMASDGRLFVDHIACVIEKAISLAGLSTGVKNYRRLAQQIIDERMRDLLVGLFSVFPVLSAPGLGDLLEYFPSRPLGGIITGDLRAVATKLLTFNTYGDLRSRLPEDLMTCGDDPGLSSRVDQLHATYRKMKPLMQGFVRIPMIDDAAKGIEAMAEFVRRMKMEGHARVIGVLTGNSTEDELKKAGAHLVLPNIGSVTPKALNKLWK